MRYLIKCNFCNKKVEHEPTFDNGIAVYLVSYVCDECKEKISLDEKDSLNRFSNTYIGEPFENAPTVESVVEDLEALDRFKNAGSGFVKKLEKFTDPNIEEPFLPLKKKRLYRGIPILSAAISELKKLQEILTK